MPASCRVVSSPVTYRFMADRPHPCYHQGRTLQFHIIGPSARSAAHAGHGHLRSHNRGGHRRHSAFRRRVAATGPTRRAAAAAAAVVVTAGCQAKNGERQEHQKGTNAHGRNSSLPGRYGHNYGRTPPSWRTNGPLAMDRGSDGGLRHTGEGDEPSRAGQLHGSPSRLRPRLTTKSMQLSGGQATTSLGRRAVFRAPDEKGCQPRDVEETKGWRRTERTCPIRGRQGPGRDGACRVWASGSRTARGHDDERRRDRRLTCRLRPLPVVSHRPTQLGHGAAGAKPACTGTGAAGTAGTAMAPGGAPQQGGALLL